MFMKERNATRPLSRHPIIKEVKKIEEGKEVREETQRNAHPRDALEKICYDANHRICVVRQKKAAAFAASPVAQTTHADPSRAPLSKSLVYQNTDGFIGCGLFCRAGNNGHRRVPCLSHCETPARQHRNQHGEFPWAAGGAGFRGARWDWKTGRMVLSRVARGADDSFVPWIRVQPRRAVDAGNGVAGPSVQCFHF